MKIELTKFEKSIKMISRVVYRINDGFDPKFIEWIIGLGFNPNRTNDNDDNDFLVFKKYLDDKNNNRPTGLNLCVSYFGSPECAQLKAPTGSLRFVLMSDKTIDFIAIMSIEYLDVKMINRVFKRYNVTFSKDRDYLHKRYCNLMNAIDELMILYTTEI